MTQKLVSPVQISLVLGTKRRKANPSWPKDIVLTHLCKIYLHSEEAAVATSERQGPMERQENREWKIPNQTRGYITET